MLCLVTQSCVTLCNPVDCSPPGSSVHEDPPGKNTGVGCHALLQGIFLTKKLNWGLLHCRWILYQLSHLGSPILSLYECFYAFPLECKLYESRNNFIYNYMIVKSHSRVRLFATPWTVAHQAPSPWDFPGMNTGVGCHFLLQGIFPTQGLKLGLPHCRQTFYRLSYQGSPII